MLVACLGAFAAYLPITTATVSLGAISRATGADTSSLQWVTSALVLPMAAFILSFGLFGDLFGRKRIFVLGLLTCALGGGVSVLAGAFSGPTAVHILWAGLAIAGTGAAALIPSTLAIISHAEPDPRHRSHLIGAWAMSLVVALVAGVYIGAGLLIVAPWKWVFAPAVVLALLAACLGWRLLEESNAREGRRIDWPGQLTALAGMAGLVYGVIEGGSAGWGSAYAIAGLAIGAAGLTAFVAVESRTPAPMLPLKLFRHPTFAAASAASVLAMFSFIGLAFLLSLYFGDVKELDALGVADRLVALFGACALASRIAGHLMKRFDSRLVLLAGQVIAALGCLSLVQIDFGTSLGGADWRMAVVGAGMGLVLPSMTASAVNSVPHHVVGAASAGINAIRQLGGAIGPAVFGVLLTTWATSNLGRRLRQLGPAGQQVLTAVQRLGATPVARQLAANHAHSPVLGAFSASQTSALHRCALVAATAYALGAVICTLTHARQIRSAKKVTW